jgi:hypothetical protein
VGIDVHNQTVQDEERCAGYLVYPFQNQEVNSHTGNLDATYLMHRLQRKKPVKRSLALFFGTDMLNNHHRRFRRVIEQLNGVFAMITAAGYKLIQNALAVCPMGSTIARDHDG